MAKNYTFSEAVELIAKGDMEAIQDIGRRFPMLVTKIAAVSALAGESFVDLASYMPDYLTANKVNKGIRDALVGMEENDEEEENDDVEETKTTKSEVKTKVEGTDDDEEENDDVEETKTTKSKAKTKVEGTDDDEENENEGITGDYDSKTSKELYTELSKRGLTKGKRFSKKADMIKALKADDKDGGTKDEDDAETNEYEGKSAIDLFKECKKRGIKAAAKKPAKFYVDLLLKADAEDEGAEEEEEGDDWDVEEVEEKSKKKAPVKKAKEEVEEDDEDEDDDWDI